MNLAKLLRKMDQCQRYLRTNSRAVTESLLPPIQQIQQKARPLLLKKRQSLSRTIKQSSIG